MFFIRVFLFIITTLCATSLAYPITKKGCANKCGDLTIPYPFGIEEGCYREGFNITCDKSHNPPQALATGIFPIINISIETGEMKVYKLVAWRCFSSDNVSIDHYATSILDDLYLFSFTKNKFTAIGRYNFAYIYGGNENNSYATGCMSYCSTIESAKNGSCAGAGCCQAPVPQGLDYYTFSWGSNENKYYDENPCVYAIIVDQEWFNFSTTDLIGTNFLDKTVDDRVPVVFDWAIRNGTCLPAPSKLPDACLSDKSYCYNATNGKGYLCNCSEGYRGNPYLENGCEDIDECKHPEKYICYGRCSNTPGSYMCECEEGKQGDPKVTKCSDILPARARLAIGISGAIVIIAAIIFVIVLLLQKKKYEVEREMNYWKNGGEELQKLIATRIQTIQVFKEKEIEKFTNNFDDNRIIGCGGRGNVYRGTLEDGIEVAIKRSKVFDDDQKEEFANEIVTLSQINHRHVVRLLGCCLEVKIPMLAYEYISNGTLFHFLHRRNRKSFIPLGMRMQIAKESAEALSTLHYSMNCRILHGDIKSLNILLDDEFRAKVSDFGASSLVPLEGNQFVEFVQGTVGYLDPECFQTHELTEKSDVYSFGVVILELITRKRAIYTDENGEKKNLAKSFATVMNEKRLVSILDNDIVDEKTINVLGEVAELALKCLNLKGEDRPTMKEVAESLQSFIKSNHDLMVFEFMDCIDAKADSHNEGTSVVTTASAAFMSTQNRSTLQIETGR